MQAAQSVGQREQQSCVWFKFWIWLVKKVAGVFWTNHTALQSRTNAIRIAFDTQMKLASYTQENIKVTMNITTRGFIVIHS